MPPDKAVVSYSLVTTDTNDKRAVVTESSVTRVVGQDAFVREYKGGE